MAVRCTRCPAPLVPHCREDHPTCTWLRCPNKDCDAHLFDVGRGLLQLSHPTRVLSWDEDDDEQPAPPD